VVTPNACTECRKKRSKCDGENPCGRCIAQSVECLYEVPVRQTKENMRTEIEALRTQQSRSERVLAALVSPDRSEQVLQQLRNGETLEEVTKKLDQSTIHPSSSNTNVTTFSRLSDAQAIGSSLHSTNTVSSPRSSLAFSDQPGSAFHIPRGEGDSWSVWGASNSFQEGTSSTHEDVMKWQPDIASLNQSIQNYPLVGTWYSQSRSNSVTESSIQAAREQGQEILLGESFGMEEYPGYQTKHVHNWTTVTSDEAFVEHLLALYFCWEYPTFASLSKEHFLEDFRNGNPRHCSSLLVNALLSIGCRFSEQAEARTDPKDSSTAGDHFFAEAERLLAAEEDRHVLTTIQALGLLSLREASCGRSTKSLYLSGQSIRLAIEMGLHFDIRVGEGKAAEAEHAVRSATFWGAFALDQAWSLSIGRLPTYSEKLKVVIKPAIIDEIEAAQWIPYTDDGAPLEKSCAQPSNVRNVYKTFCELAENIHYCMYAIYAPGAEITSQHLVDCYTRHLNWYDKIPVALRLGQNFTPAVLFAHMHYHYAILLLFRPFIKMTITGSAVSPRDICTQAADAISALVKSYGKLYSLRRTPSFVPYFVLTSSITHLVALGNSGLGQEKLRQGLTDLKEMAVCHMFAARAVDILHYLIEYWGVTFDLSDLDNDDEDDEDTNEETVKTRRYEKLCQSSSISLNQFRPNITGVDILKGIGPVNEGENPLFWPFPLQGRPLIEVNDLKRLEKNGFKISLD